MLARWIATVAALLLACAQASAHVRSERAADLGTFAAGTEHAIERSAANASPGELPTNPKTAPPARASLENSASSENAALTHCHAWENWSPLKKCASGVDKYLYGNGNPGSYTDPDGRCPICPILWGAAEIGAWYTARRAVVGGAVLAGTALVASNTDLTRTGIAKGGPGSLSFKGIPLSGGATAQEMDAVPQEPTILPNPAQPPAEGWSTELIPPTLPDDIASGVMPGRPAEETGPTTLTTPISGEGRRQIYTTPAEGQIDSPVMLSEAPDGSVERGDPLNVSEPKPVPDYGSGRGRRGSFETRRHIDLVRDEYLDQNPDHRHVGGGTDRRNGAQVPEVFTPGSTGTRQGGTYDDLTFEAPDGSRIHVNTVDTDSQGVWTEREADNAYRNHRLTGETVIAIPKPKKQSGNQ